MESGSRAMIGGSRRDAEYRRRRARWFASLSPEERDLERRYQRMVNRRFFPLYGLLVLVAFVVLWLGDRYLSPKYLGFLGIYVIFLPMAGPFLFIPTSRKWKARARSQRQDT